MTNEKYVSSPRGLIAVVVECNDGKFVRATPGDVSLFSLLGYSNSPKTNEQRRFEKNRYFKVLNLNPQTIEQLQGQVDQDLKRITERAPTLSFEQLHEAFSKIREYDTKEIYDPNENIKWLEDYLNKNKERKQK